uniref:RING-type E3 ubiquitin transferase n=1 Tax=Aplanochytrium stocchinoi TaxID=215587 RepID=A0A7S3V1L3_9STRA
MQPKIVKGPCQYFLLGCCKHESDGDCNFSHDRALCKPGSIPVPCKHFCHKGYCRNGKHCLFLHDETERKKHENETNQKLATAPVNRNAFKKPLSEIKTVKHASQSHRDYSFPLEPLGSSGADVKASISQPINQELSQAQYNAALQTDTKMYHYGTPGAFDDTNRVWSNKNSEQAALHWQKYSEVETERSRSQQQHHINNVIDNDTVNLEKPLCRFFQQGTCRYGDSCMYSHAHKEDANIIMDEATKKEIEESKLLECGICLDVISEKKDGDRRFGILQSCDHAFCLACIRNWRGQDVNDVQLDSGMVKMCPLCRAVSYFIVPCSRMVKDPNRKQRLIDEYRQKMSTLECKHFQRGKGVCPFGNSCFYAHLNPDSTLAQSYGIPRSFKTAEGSTHVETKPTLFDFVRKKR